MLKQQLIALKTIVRVEIFRFLRVWMQSLMPPVVTIVLYFLVFGHFIGPHLQIQSGLTYMQFIVPGLVMMAVVMNSYNNAAFAFFMTRFQRSIEEMLVSPMDFHILLLGFSLASITRGLLTGVIVTLVSFLFTHELPQHIGILFLSAILAAILFSLLGFLNGIFAKKFDDISTVPTFILTPLIYLGGVFYSIQQLPHVWQIASYFNPITYLVSLFRYGFVGLQTINLFYGVIILIIINVLLYSANMFLLKRGVGIRT
ncbi:MAG: ABC transporter permease [Pseudomonadota bacterium]